MKNFILNYMLIEKMTILAGAKYLQPGIFRSSLIKYGLFRAKLDIFGVACCAAYTGYQGQYMEMFSLALTFLAYGAAKLVVKGSSSNIPVSTASYFMLMSHAFEGRLDTDARLYRTVATVSVVLLGLIQSPCCQGRQRQFDDCDSDEEVIKPKQFDTVGYTKVIT